MDSLVWLFLGMAVIISSYISSKITIVVLKYKFKKSGKL